MRSFFLFVLFIAAAVTMTRQPPEIFYEASNHAVASRFGRPARTPKWVSDTDIVWEGTITGAARETRDQAHTAAIEKASGQIEEVLGLQISLPKEAVEKLVEEEKESDVDLGPTMPAAKAKTLKIEVTNAQARQLIAGERLARADKRISLTSRVFAIAVAGLFLVAGYTRISDWTKSRWRKA